MFTKVTNPKTNIILLNANNLFRIVNSKLRKSVNKSYANSCDLKSADWILQFGERLHFSLKSNFSGAIVGDNRGKEFFIGEIHNSDAKFSRNPPFTNFIRLSSKLLKLI